MSPNPNAFCIRTSRSDSCRHASRTPIPGLLLSGWRHTSILRSLLHLFFIEGIMRRLMILAAAVATLATSVACGPRAGTLEAANDALGAAQITSIQFSGNGRWYQFGQA